MANIYLKNKITGDVKQVQLGFNWGVFLLGPIYLFIKGCYLQGIGLFIVNVLSLSYYFRNPEAGIFLLIIFGASGYMAYNYKNYYSKMLESKDYRPLQV